MDFLIEYRDPLFGILIFLILIFIVSFFSYWWAYYKKREEDSKILKFFSKFEESSDKEILNIQNRKDTTKALLLLSSAFEKSGDFEKAIAIYLNLLKECHEPYERLVLLKKLGFVYFKAGFLEKSKQIFLEVLKLFPRDKEALKNLMAIYEKLQDFENLEDVVESLEELGIEKYEIDYVKALKLIKDFTRDYEKLINIYKNSPQLVRLIFDYLFKNYPKAAWKSLESRDYRKISDILWNLEKENVDFEKVKNSDFLSEIYSAKGYVDYKDSSPIFEINILLNLKKDIADFDFEYICSECKTVFPLAFYRCPNCLSVKSMQSEFIVTPKRGIDEENISI